MVKKLDSRQRTKNAIDPSNQRSLDNRSPSKPAELIGLNFSFERCLENLLRDFFPRKNQFKIYLTPKRVNPHNFHTHIIT